MAQSSSGKSFKAPRAHSAVARVGCNSLIRQRLIGFDTGATVPPCSYHCLMTICGAVESMENKSAHQSAQYRRRVFNVLSNSSGHLPSSTALQIIPTLLEPSNLAFKSSVIWNLSRAYWCKLGTASSCKWDESTTYCFCWLEIKKKIKSNEEHEGFLKTDWK